MRVTDEMVEAAARAQCASQGGYDPDEKMANDGPRWHYYAPLARAALEAALAVEGTEAEPIGYVDRISNPTAISPTETPLCEMPVFVAPITPPAGIRDTDEQRAIGNGMAIAAGIVMKCWGDTVTAGEILGAAGYRTIDDLKKDGVDQYDIDLVKPALRGQS